ncbi:homing endonuclease [Proteus phage RP7]|nr:homing endonuclease [Proteus phage RP7]
MNTYYHTIPDAPNYSINTCGEVYSKFSNRTIATYMVDGYLAVKLQINGKQRTCLVHRLLAHVYLGLHDLWDTTLEVDHIDRNRLNNSLDNLQVLSKDLHLNKTREDNGWGFSKNSCPSCGNMKLQASKVCANCVPKPQGVLKNPEISLEDIVSLVVAGTWGSAAEHLGVSESTLRRRYTKLSGGLSPKNLTKQKKNKPIGEGNYLESS